MKKVQSFAKSVGFKPKETKPDIIMQVKNAIAKDKTKFKKAITKMWGCKTKRKPNYGMLNMDAQLEVVGNKLELVGPMLDSYLQEIGKSMKGRLSRSKVTGLVNPASFFIPWTVFRHLLVLVRGYSGDVHIWVVGLKHILTLTKMDSVRKLFSPSYSSGETFFAQRHFKRVRSKAGGKTVYDGRSAINVTELTSTPFCKNYAMKTQHVTVTFFI